MPAARNNGQIHIGSFTLANLFLSADLGALSVMKENELDFSINNLFDTTPPISLASPNIGPNGTRAGYNSGNSGTLGREFIIGVRSKF